MMSIQSKDQTSIKRIFYRYQRMSKNDILFVIRRLMRHLCDQALRLILKALSDECRKTALENALKTNAIFWHPLIHFKNAFHARLIL